MSRRIAQLVTSVLALAIFAAAAPPQKHRATHKPAPRAVKEPEPPPLQCGDYIAFQVLLDRQGFSPGEIDGKPGVNFSRAIKAVQNARKAPVSGEPDCDTWHLLGGDRAGPALMDYTINDADLKGPFEKQIPRER